MSCYRKLKVFILCIIMAPVHALVHHKFEVRRSSHTRLCTTKSILTINGQFPGPTIYARRGELVVIDVINRADANISIHWHGVKMPRYPWTDGASHVTQCPISPGKRFRQRMLLSNEEGTLFWHAHSDWSRATVYGAIIILPPKTHTYPFPKPHAQVPILLGEWWNADVQQVYEDAIAQGIDANFSDAFLMNGQPGDMYPCSKQDTFKLSVEPGKTYLIRMINAMLSYIMYLKIKDHNVTVVGMDGAYTKPLNTDHIAIAPGQTIDFLLEANQPPSRYYMATKVYASPWWHTYVPTTGILEYVGNYTPPSSLEFPYYPKFDGYGWAESIHFSSKLRSLANDKHPIKVPMNITHNLFFTLTINMWPCETNSCARNNRVLASMNNISMLSPQTLNILEAYYQGIGGVFTTDFPAKPARIFNFTQGHKSLYEGRTEFGTAVYMLDYNSEVEIVFQGTNFGEGSDHPMHLHGHSFYVVGAGYGDFDPNRDPQNFNLIDPLLMNTVTVPRNGWSAIRFKANNPGVWYMHCHFDRHQTWGMKMVFIVKDGEAPNEKMLPPPPDMPRCQPPPQQLLFRI
ncbi:putative laccase-9 [Salvia miltiorrhiza]|uniref:putative laccase-9 n=1 Tax=Salvia miltiorrhiza TaxID=226208 RepID=UPI0025ACA295|nr:putative laccase-9 [Salvia miltiorrhiza]